MSRVSDRFVASFDALAGIGRNESSGGYDRLTWSQEDIRARAWFHAEAARIGLVAEVDRNGNLWAWWGGDGPDAVVCGSHLDTVVDGGAFDGALGVVSALVAVEELKRRGAEPSVPVAVAAFIEEEGARFGVPTLGSRLLTGTIDADHVRGLVDRDGVSLAAAMRSAGFDPEGLGPDPNRMSRIGCFVELHIEQGRGLVDLDVPVGVISSVWPHGRWRVTFTGAADHAGTTLMEDRHDPIVVAAAAVTSARRVAAAHGARATVGRLEVEPNTTNTVAASATVWFDARGPDDQTVTRLVNEWLSLVEEDAALHRVSVSTVQESISNGVEFDAGLGKVVGRAIESAGIRATEMSTAAGHDAAILAQHLPAAMLHVRNPTGTSHSSGEHADAADCVIGVEVLTEALEELACR